MQLPLSNVHSDELDFCKACFSRDNYQQVLIPSSRQLPVQGRIADADHILEAYLFHQACTDALVSIAGLSSFRQTTRNRLGTDIK